MATRRTEAEIRAILDECLRIERNGGDVLAYLRSENYISPKATWFNFQRGYLGRKAHQLTSGRPKLKTEERKIGKKDYELLSAHFCELIEKGMSKGDALFAIGAVGPKSAGQTFRQIKAWLKEKDPVKYDMMMEMLDSGRKTDDDPPENAMLDDRLTACVKRLMLDGSEMQPEPDYDYLAECTEKDDFKCRIMELETNVARYRYEDKHIGITVWSDEDPEEMMFEIDKLEQLVPEIPKVIRKFREGR